MIEIEKKRYQVFVSSTFADLPEERQAVFQTLLKMDCIPAGMEFFGAVDDAVFEFIKKVIDDCDYYLVIIGGRYGAPTADGISYTEKEYDYAVNERKLKVIGLLHKKPEEIAAGKSELDPKARKKLAAFRERVSTGRLVAFWENAGDLKGETALAMVTAMKMFPAEGWVRGGTLTNLEALRELHDLRKENELLRQHGANDSQSVHGLAGFDEGLIVVGTSDGSRGHTQWWQADMTWRLLFAAIMPHLMPGISESTVLLRLSEFSHARCVEDVGDNPRLSDSALQQIKIQLMALKAIDIRFTDSEFGPPETYWKLTDAGYRIMLEVGATRSGSNSE